MEIVKLLKAKKGDPKYRVMINDVYRYTYEGDSLMEDGSIETALERLTRHMKGENYTVVNTVV